MIMKGLGMTPEARAKLRDECDIIINCAASVNFNDPLLDAIEINFMGAKRMLELAKECKNLIVFAHMSTAYTNCDMSGFIEENVRDMDQDPDELI